MRNPISPKAKLFVSTKPRAAKAVAPIKAAPAVPKTAAPKSAVSVRQKAPGAMSVDKAALDTMHQLPGKPGHFQYKG
jgi:hypothetical protein